MSTSTSTPLPVTEVTEDEFDAIREAGELQPETAYLVVSPTGRESYAWAPDSAGCYWYDTADELNENHG
ncbi:hypothetical protein ACFWGP_05445 [Agromyces sp. NPDC127015]|uniref:hypothetical protein n=1 Tax=Agromyces sp. NPDC127015 TaxID=3347108 RepID=UPI003661D10A